MREPYPVACPAALVAAGHPRLGTAFAVLVVVNLGLAVGACVAPRRRRQGRSVSSTSRRALVPSRVSQIATPLTAETAMRNSPIGAVPPPA